MVAVTDSGVLALATPFIVTVLIVTTSALLVLRSRTGIAKPRGVATLGRVHAKHEFALEDKHKVSSNVYRLRFSLPSEKHILGLAIGNHVTVCADLCNPISGEGPKHIMRQYTPISSDFCDVGHFELLVKVYRKGEHPRYPEGGWMSQHLESLAVGDLVTMKGPSGRIEYLEKGSFKLGRVQQRFKHVGMIAGGTGITPMYQLIKHVLETRKGLDNLGLSLLFGNQHPSDILLREELDAFAKDHEDQFKLALTVDSVGKNETWSGFTGFVTADMIKASMPAPGSDVLILLCGPHPMVKSAESLLLSLGHAKQNIHAF